jgi:hypothetical protein
MTDMSPKTEREAEAQYRAQQIRLFDTQPPATLRDTVSYLAEWVRNFWGLT